MVLAAQQQADRAVTLNIDDLEASDRSESFLLGAAPSVAIRAGIAQIEYLSPPGSSSCGKVTARLSRPFTR